MVLDYGPLRAGPESPMIDQHQPPVAKLRSFTRIVLDAQHEIKNLRRVVFIEEEFFEFSWSSNVHTLQQKLLTDTSAGSCIILCMANAQEQGYEKVVPPL